MVQSQQNKISLCLIITLFIFDLALCANFIPSQNQNININKDILIGMGIVLDMDSWTGKSIHRSITMAISDFYALNPSYKTKIVVHTKDSKGDPVKALSAVDHLLRKANVQAIIGPETHLPSKFLSLFADKAKVPIFSFASPSSIEYRYLLQIKQDESIMANSIAALVNSYNWRNIIFVHEDTDDGREVLQYLAESFHDKNIRISYRSAIPSSATHDNITQELRKIMTFPTTVLIIHMSPSLASRLILNAKKLGMVSEEYAWILTDKTVDLLRSTNFTVIESSQGALGLRSYVPPSDRLHSLTSRWKSFFYTKNSTLVTKEVPVPALWAYDTIWALAQSLEMVGVPDNGPMLLRELLKVTFKGVSGDFQLGGGKVISNGYEIINAVDNGERRVGYWTLSEGIRRAHSQTNSDRLHPSLGSEAVIWPGGSKTAPKGWVLRATSTKRLKIGVLKIIYAKNFINIDHDVEKNVTTVTGFSVDVFNACIRALPYEVPYTFIFFENDTNYDDLVQKVYNEEIDAVVGDSTILANRSEYVDFTATYTDLGVGTLARFKKRDMWFFLKPLDFRLWMTTIGALIFTALVVWVIECMNPDPELNQQIGPVFWLILSTIFFAQRDQLSSNLSKFVMFIWLLVVLILITSYTATLTTLLTVEQFESASKGGIVGFHGNSFVRGVTVNNLRFEDNKQRAYYSYEDYARALSDGEADAIIDEIPYIKMFLSRYSGDYALVSSQPITSGFAFFFQKGSPLVDDVSREIARIRLDGTLTSLENKWFKNQLFVPSRNSTTPHALKLDRFGGVFIIIAVTSTLSLLISVYLFCAKFMEGFDLGIDAIEGF